tara:strand:+ start:1844 stop:2179 length:336 start_codon:yes stop_codon:yes gene_type:complete
MATLANPGVSSQAAFGQLGSTHIDSTAAHTSPSGVVYVAITCLENTTFTVLQSEDATKYFGTNTAAVDDADGVGDRVTTSTTFPAGVTIFGRFSAITLASGKVLAYHGPSK